jgi:hypothetical protein
MKSKQYPFACILLCLTMILSSCTKTEIIPDLKGNLVGYLYTFDEFAKSSVPEDNSGVTVTALGIKEYRAFTDKSGRFEFSKLPAGTYELQFQKKGCGILRQFGIKHLGGEPTVLYMPFDHSTNSSAFFLYALPATEITELKIENDSIFCRFSFTGVQPDLVNIQLYISLQENFETNSANLVFTNFSMRVKGSMYAGHLYYLSAFEMRPGLPFKSGDKIFFRASASPFYGSAITMLNSWILVGIDTYFDYENNRIVYPALGKESAQYSYIIP